MHFNDLSGRMQFYESAACQNRFLPMLPIIARLDGKGFHRLTQNLTRPYDERLQDIFDDVSKHLIYYTNARIAYTQSDEITLIFYEEDSKRQIYFDGKVQKMVSVLASMCTLAFDTYTRIYLQEIEEEIALFDCRCFQVPTLQEAVNCLIWREQDATRNSIQMAARSLYSHKACYGKNCSKLQDMLMAKNVNWNDYPDRFKRGAYFGKVEEYRQLAPKEIESLPLLHEARQNPELMVRRSAIKQLILPPITKLENPTETLFGILSP